MKKIVIIGMSAASVAFVTKLRSFDKDCQILCFSGESTVPYNRCLLADFLTGQMTQEQLSLKQDSFFQELHIDLRLNTWVTKIDTANKKVLAQDVWYPYDILFLGMGTKPFIPQLGYPASLSGVFNFHSLHDMHAIQKYIEEFRPATVLVVGAGLNGIEAASSFAQLGLAVGIIESNQQILPGQLDKLASDWVADIMRHQGLALIVGCKVVEICHKQNRVQAVRLDNGTIVLADMVVIAAGSQVNGEILQDTGIAIQAGSVVVDQSMRTNIPEIFAGGDVCLVHDMLTGKLTRSTTWSDAMLQGLCAATNLSLQPRLYPGIVGLRDSYFFGKYFYACGQTIGHEDIEIVTKVEDQSLKKFYLKDDQLVGFVLIGDISKIAEYKKWYSTRQKIDRLLL